MLRDKELTPRWNHVYGHQRWEKEMYTKGFQCIYRYSSRDFRVTSQPGIKTYLRSLKITGGPLSWPPYFCIFASFPSLGSPAFSASQVWGGGKWLPLSFVFTYFLTIATKLNQKLFIPSPNSLKSKFDRLSLGQVSSVELTFLSQWREGSRGSNVVAEYAV